MTELEKLERRVVKALEFHIALGAEDPLCALFEIQPTSSVITHAAQAAAAVLMAFEIGYRMDDSQNREGGA